MIAGFTSIANIDISRVVIDQMIERYREKNTMTCTFPGFHMDTTCRIQNKYVFSPYARSEVVCSLSLSCMLPRGVPFFSLSDSTGQQMNVASLEFPDESFDAVVDKGTMDSILCGEGSTANVAKMCMEISRSEAIRGGEKGGGEMEHPCPG